MHHTGKAPCVRVFINGNTSHVFLAFADSSSSRFGYGARTGGQIVVAQIVCAKPSSVFWRKLFLQLVSIYCAMSAWRRCRRHRSWIAKKASPAGLSRSSVIRVQGRPRDGCFLNSRSGVCCGIAFCPFGRLGNWKVTSVLSWAICVCSRFARIDFGNSFFNNRFSSFGVLFIVERSGVVSVANDLFQLRILRLAHSDFLTFCHGFGCNCIFNNAIAFANVTEAWPFNCCVSVHVIMHSVADYRIFVSIRDLRFRRILAWNFREWLELSRSGGEVLTEAERQPGTICARRPNLKKSLKSSQWKGAKNHAAHCEDPTPQIFFSAWIPSMYWQHIQLN